MKLLSGYREDWQPRIPVVLQKPELPMDNTVEELVSCKNPNCKERFKQDPQRKKFFCTRGCAGRYRWGK